MLVGLVTFDGTFLAPTSVPIVLLLAMVALTLMEFAGSSLVIALTVITPILAPSLLWSVLILFCALEEEHPTPLHVARNIFMIHWICLVKRVLVLVFG